MTNFDIFKTLIISMSYEMFIEFQPFAKMLTCNLLIDRDANGLRFPMHSPIFIVSRLNMEFYAVQHFFLIYNLQE